MRRFILSALLLVCAAAVRAEDWPQFLGPRRDGSSKETIAPWKGDPKVVWRAAVGEGHSSPVVAGDKVFLHDRVPGKNEERITVYSASDGKRLVSAEDKRAEFSSPFGVGPRATPTVVDDWVFTYGVTGVFADRRISVSDGRHVLTIPGGPQSMLKDYAAKNLTFGVSSSPLVEEGLVVLMVGGKFGGRGAGIVAIRRKDKSVAWMALDEPASYSSPIAVGEGAMRQIIVLTQKGLASLSPKDGTVNWQYPFQDRLNESSTTPVVVGDLLIASSVTLGSVALRLTEKDGKPSIEEVWKKPELNCYFSTPVAVGKDHLYLCSGVLALQPSITLRCVEIATGKTLWSKAKVGKYHAALVRMADDKLLMLDDSGHLSLLEPNPKEYRELARSKVCGETWAHPAVANGRVYLRDAKELICLEPGK